MMNHLQKHHLFQLRHSGLDPESSASTPSQEFGCQIRAKATPFCMVIAYV